MTSGGLSHYMDSGLLGIEIGLNKVRLALLDRPTSRVLGAVERPMTKAGGPRDPIEQEFATRSAIEDGLDRLPLDGLTELSVGATIGFPNCGVGSGPALRDWLDLLSEELDEPVLYNGEIGISYAPVSCVDFVQQVFDPTGLPLDRVELAPVSAARFLTTIRSGAITLGSGVAWSARLLNGQVLEAFEAADGPVDAELRVVTGGAGQPITELEGFDFADPFSPGHGLSPALLAPAVGVALGLHESEGPNLLDGAIAGRQHSTEQHVIEQHVIERHGVERHSVDHDDVEQRGAARSLSGQPVQQLVGGRAVQEADVLVSMPTVRGRVDEPIGRRSAIRNSSEPSARREFADPFGGEVDDLGSLQDELRAHRRNDTYQLRALPRTIERSRELRDVSAPSRDRSIPDFGDRQSDDGFDRIEDFAHPDHLNRDDGFHVSDFLLGALLMLAIVLVVALVVL